MPSVTKSPNTLVVGSSQWDETRAQHPSSHHSGSHHSSSHHPSSHQSSRSRSHSQSQTNMQMVVREPSSSSSRYTEESESTIRPSHSSSHRDAKSSHRDSHTCHASQKTALSVKGNKSTGGSLLRRATTAAAASRHQGTHETTRESSHHHTGQSSRGHSGASSSYGHSSRDQASQKTGQELQQRRTSHHSHAKEGGPGLHTRLENIEEGLKKIKVTADQPRAEASPATVTKVVIVRDAPRLVLPTSTQYAMAQAYRAGLNDGRYGL